MMETRFFLEDGDCKNIIFNDKFKYRNSRGIKSFSFSFFNNDNSQHSQRLRTTRNDGYNCKFFPLFHAYQARLWFKPELERAQSECSDRFVWTHTVSIFPPLHTCTVCTHQWLKSYYIFSLIFDYSINQNQSIKHPLIYYQRRSKL